MLPFGLTRAPAYPIGVDVGFDAVRMLQLAPALGGGLAVVAAVERPLPTGAGERMEARVAAAADVLRHVLRGRHFRGRRVVAALPREVVHVRPMRLPPMPDAELPWAVLADARDLFPFDTAKARLQFLDAGEVRQAGSAGRPGGEVRREVLVAAAGEALVDEFLERLHRAGAAVDSLDVEPCAAYRATRYLAPAMGGEDPSGGVRALVEVGAGRSQIVIGRGAQLRVIRLVEIGGRHFRRAVAQKLGITEGEAGQMRRRLAEAPAGSGERDGSAGAAPPSESVRRAASDAARTLAESLAREAALALRYHAVAFRGPGPARVWLAGAEAADPVLRAALASALPCPLEVADFFHHLGPVRAGVTPAALPGGPAPWAVALGLALRRVGDEPRLAASAFEGSTTERSQESSQGPAHAAGRSLRATAEASHA